MNKIIHILAVMPKQLINQYYNQIHELQRVGVKNEMAIKQPFDTLLRQIVTPKHYVYATEVTIKNENGKNIRPDGILMNKLRIHKGYVESKDTDDTINEEIDKKLYKDGYPKTNILFQNSIEAVLIQNGEEVQHIQMKDAESLESILKTFIDYKPKYIQKFDQALEKFKEDIPAIVDTLRNLIEEQNKTNENYVKSRDDFWKMCQKDINPEIKQEDIREMVIQHILTEDLFKSIFDESDFHHENNIARELEKLVNTFMNRTVRQNQLKELRHYYKTINTQASTVADHYEKQKFLKIVYENFYKVYNPKGADRLGVVYTPNEIVGFMIRSTDYLLERHFSRNLHDENVHILDPATGTGTFITDIIEYIPRQYLKKKYEKEIHANEIAILPYYVANLNIEFTYKQKMNVYAEFTNICFVDTLDNTTSLSWDRMSKDQGVQTSLFGGVSSENVERIKKQNQQKISVVIGNPPYNANQANFNDFNKNRKYPFIDKRIKETFVKYSTAQKTKVYDMYARFYRWAMDRVNKNGMVSFITNRSFIDSRTFDGFRNCLATEFNYCYILDLGGDIRANYGNKISNVFGIQTGVAIMFLIRKTESNENGCQIYYNNEIQDDWQKEEKLKWIETKQFQNIAFEHITPQKNNWISLADNDWEDLILTIDKRNKLTNKVKNPHVLYLKFSNGTVTNRDEWVYDFDKKNLLKKMKYFCDEYNSFVEKWKQFIKSGKIKNLTSDKIMKISEEFVNNKGTSIKWSSRLFRDKLIKDRSLEVNENHIRLVSYRPFVKKELYFDYIPIDIRGQLYDFFPTKDFKNKIISFNGPNLKYWNSFAFQEVLDLGFFFGGSQCIPFQFQNNNGKTIDNITNWGLKQFQTHYSDENITKENIFHYTYGVFHNPAYRKKYELNLKREFPRLPFYEDFRQWTDWGKQLMDLHLGYKKEKPFDLKRTDIQIQPKIKGANQKKLFKNDTVDRTKGKLKVKLKANKEKDIIKLDEQTSLSGIPSEAWEYKLGNRPALEWILNQYKEKKPRDKTIAEKFNTYRFTNYKEQVIELLKKVTTVSVETMKIIKQMENANT